MKVRRGNCYVTVEALFWLLGGRAAGYVPHTVRHEGAVHWYLVHVTPGTWATTAHRLVLDPTAKQFKTPPDYTKGRGRGFLTKGPSKRARAMMAAMVWQ